MVQYGQKGSQVSLSSGSSSSATSAGSARPGLAPRTLWRGPRGKTFVVWCAFVVLFVLSLFGPRGTQISPLHFPRSETPRSSKARETDVFSTVCSTNSWGGQGGVEYLSSLEVRTSIIMNIIIIIVELSLLLLLVVVVSLLLLVYSVLGPDIRRSRRASEGATKTEGAVGPVSWLILLSLLLSTLSLL